MHDKFAYERIRNLATVVLLAFSQELRIRRDNLRKGLKVDAQQFLSLLEEFEQIDIFEATVGDQIAEPKTV